MGLRTGFVYFYDFLGLNRNDYLVHYDFISGSGNYVPSSQEANPIYSGFLQSTGNFHSKNHSGLFNNNQYISISNASGLNSNYWTQFFIYEKTGIGQGSLFSSFGQTSGIYSGYQFGVTDTNKIFFETYDNNGPVIKISNTTLSDKNGIILSKSDNILNIHYYNFNTKELESDSYTLQSQYLLNSNFAYIGNNPLSPSQVAPFSGYIDEYVYVKNALSQSIIKRLFSGFYCDYVGTGIAVTLSGFNTVTGYQWSGYSVSSSNPTGVLVSYIGSTIDACGQESQKFIGIDGTGIISGSGIVALTGLEYVGITGFYDSGFQPDNQYVYEFGMAELTYLKKIDNQDILAFQLITNDHNKKEFNITTSYNFGGYFVTNREYTANQLNLYANGIGIVQSGYSTTGNVYNQGILISGDYYTDGLYVYTKNFNQNDLLLYDNINGSKQIVFITGSGNFNFLTGNYYLTGINANNYNIFYNGQYLYSGIDYNVINSNMILMKNTDLLSITGNIFAFPSNDYNLYITGSNATINVNQKFARDTSFVVLNGQRQLIDTDYIENSKYDLISGSGFFENINNFVYNNTKDFIQNG